MPDIAENSTGPRILKVNEKVHWERVKTCLEGVVTAITEDMDGNFNPDVHCSGEANIPNTKHWHFPEDCQGEIASPRSHKEA